MWPSSARQKSSTDLNSTLVEPKQWIKALEENNINVQDKIFGGQMENNVNGNR